MASFLTRFPSVAWISLLGLSLFTSGCGTARFYAQAIHGQAQILHRQQPAPEVCANPNTPPAVREKLELVRQLCEFATAELGLPAGEHYLRYADLGRPFVVWNIYAAPEFSVEAKSWWYPLVGRLKYRGYFNETLARAEAARLTEKGFDVHVGGVEAYSTLGWFRDPVLNTFLDRDPAGLADLIFHELAHQRLFIRGDTEFNEAFAVAVAREGVRRWLQSEGDQAALAKWEAEEHCDEALVSLVRETRRRLNQLYTESSGLAEEQLRQQKADILAEFQQAAREWRAASGCNGGSSVWFEKPVNNARLNTIATYYDLLPGFERLLADCDHDLARFFVAVERIGKGSKLERRNALQAAGPLPDIDNGAASR